MTVKQSGANELIVDGLAMYAQVHRPNKFGMYKIDLIVDDPTAETLRTHGLKIASAVASEDEYGNKTFKPKTYEEAKGKVFSFKRKTHSKDGKELTPPRIVGPDLLPFTDDIGNLSKVRVKIGLYKSTNPMTGKESQGAGLNVVQVIEHVEFKPDPSKANPLAGLESSGGLDPTDF